MAEMIATGEPGRQNTESRVTNPSTLKAKAKPRQGRPTVGEVAAPQKPSGEERIPPGVIPNVIKPEPGPARPVTRAVPVEASSSSQTDSNQVKPQAAGNAIPSGTGAGTRSQTPGADKLSRGVKELRQEVQEVVHRINIMGPEGILDRKNEGR